MSLLDRYGREIPRERVRMSLGFVSKPLPEGEPETLNGVAPSPVDDSPRVRWDSAEGAREEIR